MTEEEKKAYEIEEYCGLHPNGKCICIDRPFTEVWYKYCKYYSQIFKESEEN